MSETHDFFDDTHWYDQAVPDDGDVGSCGADADDPDVAAPSAEEVGRMLAGLNGPAADAADRADRAAASPVFPAAENVPEAPADHEVDAELYEAFLEDAGSCVGAIEEALYGWEAAADTSGPRQQICRELHTLKGASGSVGFTSLADYLHQLEDALQQDSSAISAESLFQCLDTIRQRLGMADGGEPSDARPGLASWPDPSSPSDTASGAPSPHRGGGSSAGAASGLLAEPNPGGALARSFSSVHTHTESAEQDPSVRVKASQLNRLMDMLAELVMLRNRRDTELHALQTIHQELLRSVSRMRTLGEDAGFPPHAAVADHVAAGDDLGSASSSLTEIANDILEVAAELRDCYQPVADENQAVSSFIRQFRQELVQLRRVPVSGLFRRLPRVIREAARSEGKQVELHLIGEDVGIERLLQERLYEPLLHIVRNAVSHGIEDADQRHSLGKPPAGRLTLEARCRSDLLVIEIGDDGRGLDYDALRRRGLELGLLRRDAAPSRDELSQLIFHPGFSTRGTASQIAGRGVGMDVVAETLQRMRGWVEIDSVAGQGTTVRLTFPLPSVIQHMMVFRAGEQLFAVPMQSVHGAGDSERELLGVDLVDLFGGAASGAADGDCRLVLGDEASSGGSSDRSPRRVALWVDEIVGPEEVVVRPMPALLKHHPLCCGATLSGMGDVVLVLDPHRLTELAIDRGRNPRALAGRAGDAAAPAAAAAPDVLVIDDSLSARKRLARSLRHRGMAVVEACDGVEALALLETRSFCAVFSDLEMPRMDGLQLLTEVRQKNLRQPSTWVIVSSRSEQVLKQQAAQYGASGYMAKPFADEVLEELLRQVGAAQAGVAQPGAAQVGAADVGAAQAAAPSLSPGEHA